MKLKRISRFSLTLFLLFFVSIASASAALPQTFNNVLRIIAQPLQVLFVVLPASSAFPYLLKFLYFIILAALWSGIASQITKDREGGVKRAFKIFGVIVALVSAIFIPQSWLMYAFKIPAMISIVLFFLVVPLGGFFLCNKLITGETRAARLGRAFIWWVIALLVLAMVEFIQKHPDPALQQMISPVLDALNIGAVVALFAGLYNFAMGLGAGTAAESVWNRIHPTPAAATTTTAQPAPARTILPNAPTRPPLNPPRTTSPPGPTPSPAPTPPRGPTTPPVFPPKRPRPTVHPNWPGPPSPKHDPTPPTNPTFPIPRQIPVQPKPAPSTIVDPIEIDLSPGFLPIKNQGNSSACAAFAAGGMMEFLLNQRTEQVRMENELSELFLWYFFRRNKMVNEGTHLHDLPSIGPRSPYETFWTWIPVGADGLPTKFRDQPSPPAIEDGEKKKVTKITALAPNDPDSWVAALLQHKPILIGIDVDDSFMRGGKNSLVYSKEGSIYGGHAIVIVGFSNQFPNPGDAAKSVAAFKIRNSWGSRWGENGYIWVERDLLVQLLIATPLVFEGIGGNAPQQNHPQDGPPPLDPKKIKVFLENMETIVRTLEKIMTIEIKNEREISVLIEKFCEQTDKNKALKILEEIEAKLSLEENLGRKEYTVLKRMIPLENSLVKLYESLWSLSNYVATKIRKQDSSDKYYAQAERIHQIKERLKQIIDNDQQKISVIAEALKKLENGDRTTKGMIETMKQSVEVEGISHVCTSLKRAMPTLKEEYIIPTIQAVQSISQDLKMLKHEALEMIEVLKKIKSFEEQ